MSDKSSNLASLPAVVKRGIESRLKDLHTSMPGIIESFDPQLQLATVIPAIKRVYITETEEGNETQEIELPILINVPVIFPRGGGFTITLPVKEGDECLLVFSERSFDLWLEKSGVQIPGARRFHSISDAVAYVGLSSKPNAIPEFDPENLHIKKDDGTAYIKIKADSSIEVVCDSNVTVNSQSDVIVEASGNINLTAPNINITGNVSVQGNIESTGTVTNNGINIGSTHIHTGSPTAPAGPISNTGVPI